MSAALFTPDFIQSVANSLDEFDPSFLRPDGDIDFERDFGQWFNHPDDVGGVAGFEVIPAFVDLASSACCICSTMLSIVIYILLAVVVD